MLELRSHVGNGCKICSIVQHTGIAMKGTGVAHILCSFLQFGKLLAVTRLPNLKMMPFPMIYMCDLIKLKKRTLNQHS